MDCADPGAVGDRDRLRREDRRRLYIRQRPERNLVAVAGEHRCDRDILRDGDRRQLRDRGGDLMPRRAVGFAIGIVFGFTLCWSGMASPEVIRATLLFQSSYLFLFMFS